MRKYLLTLVLVGLFGGSLWAQTDSLRLEMEGEKAFVIHRVLAKQTLFALAQRYETSIEAIRKENPTVASGLQVGQTLKIPYGGKLAEPEPPKEESFEYLIHQVKEGETLFAIAQKYKVNIVDLKAWNELASNAISLNQELKIQVPKSVTSGAVAQDQNESTPPAVEETSGQMEVQEGRDTIAYEGTPFQQLVIEGIAEVIDEEEPSSMFFALHRTAKKGTVIKVRNLMNDLTVYVRVIGTIPETSNNEDVLIKLNQRAYENLKAIDKRFRVELSYFQ